MRVHDPNRRNLLEGKVALVTGGGGSLGLAIARLFLKDGARVVLADRNREGLATTVAKLDDVQASTLVGHGARAENAAAAVETVVQRHGALDVLVTLAGMATPPTPVTDLAVADFDGGAVVIVSGWRRCGARQGRWRPRPPSTRRSDSCERWPRRWPAAVSASTPSTQARTPTAGRRPTRGSCWAGRRNRTRSRGRCSPGLADERLHDGEHLVVDGGLSA